MELDERRAKRPAEIPLEDLAAEEPLRENEVSGDARAFDEGQITQDTLIEPLQRETLDQCGGGE